MINNSPEQIRLRRDQTTLRIVGTGTIAFEIWSLVKVYGVLFLEKKQILAEIVKQAQEINPEATDEYNSTIFMILLIGILAALIFGLIARLFIGFSAISEGKGKHRSALYIIVACVMIIASMITVFTAVTGSGSVVENSDIVLRDKSSLSSILIELTSMILMIEMVAASVRIRRITKRRGDNRN